MPVPDTNLTMRERKALENMYILLKSNRRLKLIILTFDPPSAPKIKNRDLDPLDNTVGTGIRESVT